MIKIVKREYVPLILIAGIALIGIFIISGKLRTSRNTSDSTANTTVGDVVAIKKTINDVSASINYQIDASYPEIQGLPNVEAQRGINGKIRDFIDGQIITFKTDFTAAQQNPNLPPEIANGTNQLIISYSVGQANDDIVSVNFQEMNSIVGMAHPANTNTSMTFDAKNGNELALSDIFEPKSNYLGRLSQISRQQLNAKFSGQDGANFLVNEGTEPHVANFQNFVLTPDSLQIIFDPATVAADFAGTQTVTIPLSQLSGILKPEYQ